MSAGDAPPAAAARRYRRWLMAYPRRWREQHAEALVGTLLDAADADGRARPAPGEVADLVVHGLAERARLVLPSRASTQLAAWLSLSLGSALSLAALVLGELMPSLGHDRAFFTGLAGRVGSFATTGPALYAPFLIAAVLALTGAIRAARRTLWITAAVALLLPAASSAAGVNRPPLGLVAALAWCALVAAAGLRRSPVATRALAALSAVAVAGAMAWTGTPGVRSWIEAVRLVHPEPFAVVPYYRFGPPTTSSAAVEVAVLAALAAAALAALLTRRRHGLAAVLLVLPAALLALGRAGYWSADLSQSAAWPALAPAALAAATIVERLHLRDPDAARG